MPGRPGTGSRSRRRVSSSPRSCRGGLQPRCNSAQRRPKLGVAMAAARLDFRVLGPLEVRIDGAERPLVGTRQRALLALLLVHANEPVSSDRLVDELWSESPPPTAQASLRVAISKLRRLLGEEHRHVLETVTGGYRLALDGAAARLGPLRGARSTRREARRRRPGAAALLDDALALWRGPPLDDLAAYAFARLEAARLAELRLAALEERVDAELALGRHDELVPELEALVAEQPVPRAARAASSCSRSTAPGGRQRRSTCTGGAAPAARDELGLEPGEELRRLEQAILAHDRAIAGPRPPGAPARRGRRARRRARWPSRSAPSSSRREPRASCSRARRITARPLRPFRRTRSRSWLRGRGGSAGSGSAGPRAASRSPRTRSGC